MSGYLAQLRRLFVPIIVCAALLVPFFIYDRLYVRSKQTYLTERGFRLLAAMGDQVGSMVQARVDYVRAAGARFNHDTKIDADVRAAWLKNIGHEGVLPENRKGAVGVRLLD